MPTNNSWNSNIPVQISLGGTNATSMATSTGIVKYDGTNLVTSSTAKIDSSNRYTNTSQPAFFANITGTLTDVTGDGTAYTVVFDNTLFDQNSNFNTSTGTFTAPIAGVYHFSAGLLGLQLIATMTTALTLSCTGQDYAFSNNDGAFVGNNLIGCSWTIKMAINDTANVIYTVGNGTKVVDIFGTTADPRTYFCGFLVC